MVSYKDGKIIRIDISDEGDEVTYLLYAHGNTTQYKNSIKLLY